MNLKKYKALFLAVTAILVLLTASPALQRILVYPQTEFFTEISLLDPEHMAQNYPYNITSDESYSVFLGVTNKLSSCAYYQVEVKFRNETQSAPNNFDRTPSNLSSLYNLNIFVADHESLDIPLNFSFNYSFHNVARTVYSEVTVPGRPGQNATVEQRAENITLPLANFNYLKLNGSILNLQGCSSDWNPKTNKFYGNLVFELWIYNSTISDFQYNERFVDLKFNMTSGGTGF
jgi:hypothetical protein